MPLFPPRILDLLLSGRDSTAHAARVAREWLFLKLSGMTLRLGHRVLLAGTSAFRAGALGMPGLRKVFLISSRLDRMGLRLMRWSIGRQGTAGRDRR
ncbi:MAG: hypothetical protein J0I79_31340 [Mesorhizobium sp.]|uniref:hypothetical protein n=1 Tax=Mesorhizobium sp. TaxID=1871066 RepID=UPI001AD216C6|nr:hypothetical protein [Mesorhizobium sp.]MBN9222456.1 hypothetical protein [Mesorhizobium sp.]